MRPFFGAVRGTWTHNRLLTRQLLYHWAITASSPRIPRGLPSCLSSVERHTHVLRNDYFYGEVHTDRSCPMSVRWLSSRVPPIVAGEAWIEQALKQSKCIVVAIRPLSFVYIFILSQNVTLVKILKLFFSNAWQKSHSVLYYISKSW